MVTALKRKGSLRDIGFYLLIAALLLMTVLALRGFDSKQNPLYSEIRTLFEQHQVSEVESRGNKLTLKLRQPWNGSTTVSYDLPSFWVFYEDFNDMIVSQYQAGIITSYNYQGEFQMPAWMSCWKW